MARFHSMMPPFANCRYRFCTMRTLCMNKGECSLPNVEHGSGGQCATETDSQESPSVEHCHRSTPVRDCIEELRREHGLSSIEGLRREHGLALDTQRIASRVEERALLDEAYGVLRIVELWFAAENPYPQTAPVVQGLVSELCRRMRGE
jgi:hypothetical protein